MQNVLTDLKAWMTPLQPERRVGGSLVKVRRERPPRGCPDQQGQQPQPQGPNRWHIQAGTSLIPLALIANSSLPAEPPLHPPVFTSVAGARRVWGQIINDLKTLNPVCRLVLSAAGARRVWGGLAAQRLQ